MATEYTLDNITGYAVMRTISNGAAAQTRGYYGFGELIARIDGADQYGRALAIAKDYRIIRERSGSDATGAPLTGREIVDYAIVVDLYGPNFEPVDGYPNG